MICSSARHPFSALLSRNHTHARGRVELATLGVPAFPAVTIPARVKRVAKTEVRQLIPNTCLALNSTTRSDDI